MDIEKEVQETINQGISGLCSCCDPNCPAKLSESRGKVVLPHCYLGSSGRTKFIRLQEAVIGSTLEGGEFTDLSQKLDVTLTELINTR